MGMRKKIVLLGDSAVGKTSLIRRFVFDIFDDSYVATIGSKVTRKQLLIETPDKTVDLTLVIWDILGREGYRALHARTFAGVHGGLVIADMTRRETLRSLERYWIPLLFKVVENVPLVFVGNKNDLTHEFAFPPEDVREMAGRYNLGLGPSLPSSLSASYAASAKTGVNVESAFKALGHLILAPKGPEDPVRELYQSLIAVGVSRTSDKETAIGALDAIIVDFCEGFEDDRYAMSLLRQEIIRAGIDVRRPTRNGLIRLVEYLAEADSEVHEEKAVSRNKERRLGWATHARP